MLLRCRLFWHATLRLRIAPYVDIILHRGRFWAKSAASGSVRWCCFRSCWTVLSRVMRGRPGCLLQSAEGKANRILLASALSSMRIIRCYLRPFKPSSLKIGQLRLCVSPGDRGPDRRLARTILIFIGSKSDHVTWRTHKWTKLHVSKTTTTTTILHCEQKLARLLFDYGVNYQHNRRRLWTTSSDRRTPFTTADNTSGKTTVVKNAKHTDYLWNTSRYCCYGNHTQPILSHIKSF